MKSESEVSQLSQIEAAKHGCILWRNNSGAFTDATGRHVRYGLGNISKKQNEKFKSTDLIGITSVLITPEMVGQTIGVFTAFEVKGEGWREPKNIREIAQLAFIFFVKARGGIASFISSVDQVTQNLRR